MAAFSRFDPKLASPLATHEPIGGAAGMAAARDLARAGLGAIRAGTSMGPAWSANKLGQETSGSSSIAPAAWRASRLRRAAPPRSG